MMHAHSAGCKEVVIFLQSYLLKNESVNSVTLVLLKMNFTSLWSASYIHVIKLHYFLHLAILLILICLMKITFSSTYIMSATDYDILFVVASFVKDAFEERSKIC